MPPLKALFVAAALCVATRSALAVDAGQAPPSCPLKTFRNGKPVNLAQYKGKVVYLDFWASWCSPCSQSMGFMEGLQNQLGPQGFEVIGVNVDENRQEAEDFLAGHPVKFTLAADTDGQCSKLYGIQVMPSTYLIDRKGAVRHVLLGFRLGDSAEIREKVQALLAEK